MNTEPISYLRLAESTAAVVFNLQVHTYNIIITSMPLLTSYN